VENERKVSRTIQNEDTGCKIIVFSGKVKNSMTNSKVIVLQMIKVFPHILWSLKVYNHVHKNP